MAEDFAGRVAWVTGAGSGIGRATARAFARAGAAVVAVDVDGDAARAVVAAIEGEGGRALAVVADVAEESQVEAAVASAVERFGAVHHVVNAAALADERLATLPQRDAGDFDALMAVNVRGVFLCLRHALSAVVKAGGGTVVNVASIAGLRPLPRQGLYTASKHAVVGLTTSAAVEFGRKGVRVNAVCPGFIDTPMLERGAGEVPALREAMLARCALGRLGTAEEVAEAIVWLSSGASSFVTGHALVADGGWTLG